ncbi:guanylate kinase [Desulfobulbus alkaliphilus]|uniref:guanylate kinase n=1 Tax=Desulfobulbus alkaliphilus TaxID=869814 RepID=UPI001964525E|nr:guanylate kinase [Desulfobulbus alkaliphilus]MBM9537350.1 guanylate kinase [Desulfobulbus alkaliphilus]
MASGLLLVLSAPSGCGKTTIVRKVMATLPGLVFSVSHTTRPARAGEVDGVQYHFVDEAAFLQIRDQQPSGFLEWARVHGNLYGTGVETVRQLQQTGCDVILDIDVQGAAQVRERVPAVSVFIAPPSMQELERRLRGRGTEEGAILKKRLDNAAKEIAAAGKYQYLIVNDRLDEAVETFRSIIIAERSRQRRTLSGQPVQLACSNRH